MKFQTLHLLVAALGLAAGASLGRAQDVGPQPMPASVMWQPPDYAQPWPDQPAGPPPNYFAAEDTRCYDGCCGCCSHCCHSRDVWGSVEFLMWWGKGTPLPPLATTSTDPADGGVIGQPTTSILFGNELVNEEVQAGGRVIWGLWLDRDHNVAATGRFFGLGGDSETFTSDPGLAVLARPFNNALLPGFPPDALPITSPGLVEGTINATARTDNIISAEAGLEIMMHRDRLRRVDLIAGYQFLRLDDSLQIDSFSTVIGGGPPVGTTFALSDRFATENEFHGGTIGLKSRMARGRWSLDGMVKAAFGSSRQHVSIVGFGEQTIPPGGPTPLNGGFLALPTNIGEYERSRFVVIPEVTINLKYHVTPNSAFHIGYNFIWMSEVVLSGDQIDTTLNLTQQAGPLVGPARPAFNFRDQDYWLQGLNFGWSWEF